jgi:hypothetical protein
MNKQTLIGGLIAVAIVGSGAFYGGMTYAKGKTPTRGQFANGQFTGAGTAGARGARTGGMGGFAAGEILSKDASSITIQMPDGSTKIILVSTSTQIMKSAAGSLNDLTTGTEVIANGSTNGDGSITAQSIQIRPAGASPFGGQQRTTQ